MDKLILKREKTINKNSRKPIFIKADVHKQLTKLKDETGISMIEIVDAFLRYDIDNVVIKEEDE